MAGCLTGLQGSRGGPFFIARVRGSESFSSHLLFPAWDNVDGFILLRGARGRAAGRQTKRQEREDGQGARPTCSWVARLAALTVLVAAPRLCATGSQHPEGTRSRSCAPTWERWHWAWCCPRGGGTKLLAGHGALHSCVPLPGSLLLLRRHEPQRLEYRSCAKLTELAAKWAKRGLWMSACDTRRFRFCFLLS